VTWFSEAQLEEYVLSLLAEAGWATVHGVVIAPGEPGAERHDYRQVILEQRLLDAIRGLNPDLPESAVRDVVDTVRRPESAVAESENWRFYQLLTQGVPVEYRDKTGMVKAARAALVDWADVAVNDMVAVNQFTIHGPKRDRRPDVVLFVNGLPLGLIELKATGSVNASLKSAFQQVETYRAQIPDLFTYTQVVVLSDGMSAKAAPFSGAWEHYAPWKTIDGTLEPTGAVPQIEVLTKGLLTPAVFLDWVRSYVAVYGDGESTVRKQAKYHQYWAVRKAVQRTVDAVRGDGRVGVVWHTQGSGKSLEMAYYAGQVMRHPDMGNPTVIVLTDRNQLDDQLHDETFAAAKPGAPLPESPVQADSRDAVKTLLAGRQSGGIIFSTIQKFGLSREDRDAGKSFPVLSTRANIVVMVDEAHRTNYGFISGFARNLRDALPNASFVAFTGTPIEEKDRSTTSVFGTYIDVYDMTQSVADGATVKVFYEARLAKVELPDEAHRIIDTEFVEATEGSEDEVVERLKTRWARVEAIVGSDQRIAALAEDIVTHWEARREVLTGKGMIVAMSRRIAVKLYDAIVALRPEWHTDDDSTGRVKVVITGSATDEAPLQKHLRSKAEFTALKARATDPQDELELVIVRDMWLTGFDSPAMHTMYVDKPMKGAALMQAITRVNRVFRDKPAGLVVDYIGIAEDLKSALADYTKRDRDDAKVGQDVARVAIPEMLAEHSIVAGIITAVDWRAMLATKAPGAQLHAIAAVVDHLLATERDDVGVAPSSAEELAAAENPGEAQTRPVSDSEQQTPKQRFMAHTRRLRSFFVMVPTSSEANTIRDDVAFFDAVRAQLAKLESTGRGPGGDGAEMDTAIQQIISEHVAGGGVIDIYAETGLANPDLSLIDDDFIESFRLAANKNVRFEMLKRLLQGEVRKVGQRNVVAGRLFSEMLDASLNRYHNRALDTAQVVAEMVDLAKKMKADAERGKDLGLTEDEIAFYDALRTNDSAVEVLKDEVMKKLAHELTGIVRRDATTDWNVKEQVRAKLRTSIKRLLLRHGYPPDQEPTATELVMEQAELMGEWQDGASWDGSVADTQWTSTMVPTEPADTRESQEASPRA